MQLFLTLCSLVALTAAKPQYNYGSGTSGTFGSGGLIHGGGGSTGGAFGFGKGTGGGSGDGYFSSPGFGGISDGSSGGGSHFGGGDFSLGGGNFQGGSTGGSAGGFGAATGGFGGATGTAGGFGEPIVHKQFITVSAPEDNDSLEQTKHFVIGRPQRNYRVVFIKAPSSSNANVKLSAEYAPQEEKTAIYVLTKKDSQLEVNDIATPAPTVPSKPEVFFIKYKTEEEAQHAQKHIQAEYDKIEGTSEHTDGGIAPLKSVVGILDGSTGAGSSHGIVGGIGGGSSAFGTSGGASKNSVYLPPSGRYV